MPGLPPRPGLFSQVELLWQETRCPTEQKAGNARILGGGYSPLPGRDAEPLLLISVRLCMKRRIIQEPGIVPGSGKQ